MRRNFQDRDVSFSHQDGCLVRRVTSADGRTYVHTCEQQAFEQVAWALEETPASGAGLALGQIVAQEHLPFTQVDVALAFLHERGLIDRRHRRNYPASASVHLDAMVEWHALAHESACV